MSDVVAEINQLREEQKLAAAMILAYWMTEIITAPPVYRQRWWQFWRVRKPLVRL